jgi:hypothetical protein
MLEIPGEEAPTDPGLQARQRKAAEEKIQQAARKRRSRILGAVAGLVVIGLGAAGAYGYQVQQSALTLDLDDYYVLPLSEVEGAPTGGDPAAPPVDAAPTQGTASTHAVRHGNGTSGGGGSGSQGPALKTASGGPEGGPSGPLAIAPASPGGLGVGLSDIGVGFVDADRVLTDDNEIYDMAKRVMLATQPQLQACYNQRLKIVDGLKGAWEVSFTIAKDGTTKNTKISGVNGSDSELEACMTRSVGGWHFAKIAKDLNIRRTVRFGAGGW